MQQYLQLLNDVNQHGVLTPDRTGTGTKSLFGAQLRFDLSQGFPLVTTKKIHVKSIIYELLWFLKGDTNVRFLQEHGVRIWNEWANKNGDLGPVYGHQWRSWQTTDGRRIDQISTLLENLKQNPHSRRHIVSAWNVGDLDKMALPPCHCLFQFHIANNKLSCQLYQRSADLFLGVPFNIASYSLLTMMLAHVLNLELGSFIHTFGDVHIYTNHQKQVTAQLERTPYHLPTMHLNPKVKSLFDFVYEDFTLENYEYHPTLSAKVAI